MRFTNSIIVLAPLLGIALSTAIPANIGVRNAPEPDGHQSYIRNAPEPDGHQSYIRNAPEPDGHQSYIRNAPEPDGHQSYIKV